MKFASESALHQKFLENTHDAVIILDAKFKIIDCNHVALKWYGYTASEIKKLNLSDLRAPDEREKISLHMSEVGKNGGGIWETVHQRKDGSTFAVEVSSTPIELDNKIVFYHVVRDISERKRIEHSLRASEDRYRQMVEFFPDTVFIHRDAKIVFMNKAGLKLFGAKEHNEIIGRSLWDLYPPERHGIVHSRNQMMLKTKQAVPTVEHIVLRLDGGRVNVEATACIIEYEGTEAFFVTMRDITERKKHRSLLDMQHTVSTCLIEAENIPEACKCVLEIICTNLNFDVGNVWINDKSKGVLRLASSWYANSSGEQLYSSNTKATLLKNEGVSGQVLATAEPCWVENASGDETTVAVPIINENEILGVFECTKHKSLKHDDIVLQTLKSLADQIGLFLKRKKYEKDLVYISTHDPITGLANRVSFTEALQYEINHAASKDQSLAVVFLDIDGFNIINEAMGHNAGDEIIKTIASRLIALDLAAEMFGRFGPTFAIIFNNIDNDQDVQRFIKSVRDVLGNSFEVHDQKINLHFNCGVAIYPGDGENANALMKSAAIALNSAKEIGAGATQFSNSELNQRAQKRLKIENDLRTALLRKEFSLQYQPIIDTTTMQITGFESLIRWQKDSKFINPSEFIPLAEKNHMIVPLGEWIMRTACTQYKEWQSLAKQPIFISVNISPVQFKHGAVMDMIAGILSDLDMQPQSLKIEVTESALMDDAHKSIDMLQAIKNMGVKISIDDFGSGYSSLNYLRHLPIDYLKIDQSFIRNMTTDPNDAAIVKTIIDLAHNLNYQVIAEGVETQAQLNFLTTLGCYNIQGYYFSPPLPVAEATALLQQNIFLP